MEVLITAQNPDKVKFKINSLISQIFKMKAIIIIRVEAPRLTKRLMISDNSISIMDLLASIMLVSSKLATIIQVN
jgi:hypothetical protein